MCQKDYVQLRITSKDKVHDTGHLSRFCVLSMRSKSGVWILAGSAGKEINDPQKTTEFFHCARFLIVVDRIDSILWKFYSVYICVSPKYWTYCWPNVYFAKFRVGPYYCKRWAYILFEKREEETGEDILAPSELRSFYGVFGKSGRSWKHVWTVVVTTFANEKTTN